MKDPGDYFYAGAGRGAAVEALFDGVRHAEPLLLISTPSGSGRSMVLRRFVSLADPDLLAIAVVTGDIMMSATQCCGALCDGLAAALPTDDAPNSTDNFPDLIARVRESGRTPVFVLDDAHELGEETRLAVLALARVCSVPLILAGDQMLSAAMDSAVVPVNIGLPAFTEQDTAEFVAAWLSLAGEEELPSHRVLVGLHLQSRGLPGEVVKLLQSGVVAMRRPLFPAGLPVWHLIYAGAALLLLVWLIIPVGAEPDGSPAVADMGVPLPLPLPVPGQVAVAANGAQDTTSSRAATRTSRLAVPSSIDAVPFVPAPVPPPIQASAALPAPAGLSEAISPRYSRDEEALLTESGSRFTLQLFASFNEQAARQLASRHPVNMRVFRTTREDEPWHVAVTGSYGSKEGAQAAVAGLPVELQALKPWPRSLQGIQEELRRRK